MRLYRVIEAALNLPAGTVDDPDLGYGEVEGWDSLGQLVIMAAVEQAYDVRFSMRQVTSLTCPGLITAALRNDFAVGEL